MRSFNCSLLLLGLVLGSNLACAAGSDKGSEPKGDESGAAASTEGGADQHTQVRPITKQISLISGIMVDLQAIVEANEAHPEASRLYKELAKFHQALVAVEAKLIDIDGMESGFAKEIAETKVLVAMSDLYQLLSSLGDVLGSDDDALNRIDGLRLKITELRATVNAAS